MSKSMDTVNKKSGDIESNFPTDSNANISELSNVEDIAHQVQESDGKSPSNVPDLKKNVSSDKNDICDSTLENSVTPSEKADQVMDDSVNNQSDFMEPFVDGSKRNSKNQLPCFEAKKTQECVTTKEFSEVEMKVDKLHSNINVSVREKNEIISFEEKQVHATEKICSLVDDEEDEISDREDGMQVPEDALKTDNSNAQTNDIADDSHVELECDGSEKLFASSGESDLSASEDTFAGDSSKDPEKIDNLKNASIGEIFSSGIDKAQPINEDGSIASGGEPESTALNINLKNTQDNTTSSLSNLTSIKNMLASASESNANQNKDVSSSLKMKTNSAKTSVKSERVGKRQAKRKEFADHVSFGLKRSSTKIDKSSERASTPPTLSVDEKLPKDKAIGAAKIKKEMNVSPVFTPSPARRKKSLAFDRSKTDIPFKEGWMREVVHRATFNKAKNVKAVDIYYFTPENTKLRSMPDVAKYLSEHKECKLNLQNFTFSKEKIYREPFEIEREARPRLGDGTESTPVQMPQKSKGDETPVVKKAARKSSPARLKVKWTPMPKVSGSHGNTPDSGSHQKSTKKLKRNHKELDKTEKLEKFDANPPNDKTSTDSITSDDSVTEISNKSVEKSLELTGASVSADQVKTVTDTPKTPNNELNQLPNSVETEIQQTPVLNKTKRIRKISSKLISPKSFAAGENNSLKKKNNQDLKCPPKKRPKIKIAPKKTIVGMKISVDPSYPKRCSEKCNAARYEYPTVKCVYCMCLFHPICVNGMVANYMCKPCILLSQERRVSSTSGVIEEECVTLGYFLDAIDNSNSSLLPEISLFMEQAKNPSFSAAAIPLPPPPGKPLIHSLPSAVHSNSIPVSPSQSVPIIRGPIMHYPGLNNHSKMNNLKQILSTPLVSMANMTKNIGDSWQTPVTSDIGSNSIQQLEISSNQPPLRPNVPSLQISMVESRSSTPPHGTLLLSTNTPHPASVTSSSPLLLQNCVNTNVRSTTTSSLSEVSRSLTLINTVAPIMQRNSSMVINRQDGSSLEISLANSSSGSVLNSDPSTSVSATNSPAPISYSNLPLSVQGNNIGTFQAIKVRGPIQYSTIASNPQYSSVIGPPRGHTVANQQRGPSDPTTFIAIVRNNRLMSPSSFPHHRSPVMMINRLPFPTIAPRVETQVKHCDAGVQVNSPVQVPNGALSLPVPHEQVGKSTLVISSVRGSQVFTDFASEDDAKQGKNSSLLVVDGSEMETDHSNSNGIISKKLTSLLPQPSMESLMMGFRCLNIIFQNLRVCDLIRAAQVCHTWKILASQHFLWEEVNCKDLTINDWKSCTTALKKYGTKVLNLRGIKIDNTKTSWKDFTKSVNSLSSVEHLTFGQIPPFVLESVAYSLSLLQCLECYCLTSTLEKEEMWSTVSKLEFFPFQFLRQLKKLKIRSAGGLSSKEAPTQLGYLKGLQHLSLTSLKDFPSSHFSFLTHMTNLVALELGDCYRWTEKNYEDLGKLTNLKHLKLENGGGLHIGLAEALEKLDKLQQLELMKYIIPWNLGPSLQKLDSLKRVCIWPFSRDQLALVNCNTLRLVPCITHVSYFCWGIISPDELIPPIQILKKSGDDDDDAHNSKSEEIQEVDYEDLFVELCNIMIDTKVEIKCIAEKLLNEYCTSWQR